jgi:hypothetical protein
MATKTKIELPEGVEVKDTIYPKWNSKDRIVQEAGDSGRLSFYLTTGFGWCVATLLISNTRKPNGFARTYAVRCSDGAQVRIGKGPHVTKEITVYIRKSRVKALQKYIDMFSKGQVEANEVRDRISSRRAQGVLNRANGLHSWRWNV